MHRIGHGQCHLSQGSRNCQRPRALEDVWVTRHYRWVATTRTRLKASRFLQDLRQTRACELPPPPEIQTRFGAPHPPRPPVAPACGCLAAFPPITCGGLYSPYPVRVRRVVLACVLLMVTPWRRWEEVGHCCRLCSLYLVSLGAFLLLVDHSGAIQALHVSSYGRNMLRGIPLCCRCCCCCCWLRWRCDCCGEGGQSRRLGFQMSLLSLLLCLLHPVHRYRSW